MLHTIANIVWDTALMFLIVLVLCCSSFTSKACEDCGEEHLNGGTCTHQRKL